MKIKVLIERNKEVVEKELNLNKEELEELNLEVKGILKYIKEFEAIDGDIVLSNEIIRSLK